MKHTDKRFRTILLVVYGCIIFIGTHWPGGIQLAEGTNDKSMHYVAYFGLAILCCGRWQRRQPSAAARGKRYAWIIIAIAGYACFDELTQSFSPGRSPDVADFVADMMGAITGVILYWRIESRWPKINVAD